MVTATSESCAIIVQVLLLCLEHFYSKIVKDLVLKPSARPHTVSYQYLAAILLLRVFFYFFFFLR